MRTCQRKMGKEERAWGQGCLSRAFLSGIPKARQRRRLRTKASNGAKARERYVDVHD